jgi:TRAP-type mannitol/chloroaromatic compound transport system permease large subunit
MELVFLAILVLLMAFALGSGYPVAFALPGSAIISIVLAAGCGYVFGGSADAYFAHGGPGQWLSAGVTNLRGIYWEVERDTLIAIPLFIFMGIMLQRSKIAEDLLVTMAQLFGPIPGGLGISVVFVGALLAATTGIVGATVVAMGLISLPAMLRNNYSKSLATGTIAASGTLGQIIPPSIVLIILADQLASATDQASSARKALFKENTGELSMPSFFDVSSTSAGEMFLGAFVPGLVLVGLYMLFILVIAILRPSMAPAVRLGDGFNRDFWVRVFSTLIPPLALIILVLGSILSGIATVNQAGAIGAAGALIMAGYRLRESGRGTYHPAMLAIVSMFLIGITLTYFSVNVKNIKTDSDVLGVVIASVGVVGLLASLAWSGWRVMKIDNTLYGVMVETAKTTSLVFIILLGAAMLTAAFRAFGGEDLVRDFLNSMPGGFWSKFIIVMGVIFILGFFLDFIEIAVVVVPIVAPILLADPSANITAVWLGVMIGLNIQTSFLTPPFGFALFYLRGVAPAIVKTIDMYKGVIAFICLQLLALGIVGYYPALVNYLPTRVSLTAETAPPPKNPKLQYCIEEYTLEQFADSGDALKSAVSSIETADMSYLPKKLVKNVSKSFSEVEKAMTLLPEAKAAEAVVVEASGDYRPLHREVRHIQMKIRKIAAKVKNLERLESRLYGDENAAAKAEVTKKIEALNAEAAALEASVPSQWEEKHKAFKVLLTEEAGKRNKYRRAADSSYEPVVELQNVLASLATFEAMNGKLEAMKAEIEKSEPEAMLDPLRALSKEFGAIGGAGDIKKAVSKARKDLKSKTPKPEKALSRMDDAIAEYQEQLIWRRKASSELAPKVAAYEAQLRETVGIRTQKKLTRDQALYVAACSSGHMDISLNF